MKLAFESLRSITDHEFFSLTNGGGGSCKILGDTWSMSR